MNIDRRIALVLPSLALGLSACANSPMVANPPPSEFGDANRATMLAQVIDPDPDYDTLVPETSANKAAAAVQRYENDEVKQPETVSTVSSD